jgi:uncharacterized protein (DUF1015 family)
MAEIIPFRGILYNVSKVTMEDVLAPPYDIITPEYQEKLYRKSPYNIVRIDFGKDQPGDNEVNNRYTRAKQYLKKWLIDGILIRSDKPSFYIYQMSYMLNNREKHLIGFLGLIKLEEFGKGTVHPHECTYSKPKQDRLNLLRICEANISPIFSLYKSTDKGIPTLFSRITITKPYIESKNSEGAIHRLWLIDKQEDLKVIQKELKDKAVFIADGHHRYETAFEFQREMKEKEESYTGKEPFNYVLMFFTNMFDEGITILPAHRLIKEIPRDTKKILSEYFEIEPVKEDFDIARRMSGRKQVFGFYQNKENIWYICRYKKDDLSEIRQDLREIDVFILHELVFKRILKVTDIEYEMDFNKAIEKVRKGQFSAAFFLNPTRVEDVERAAISSTRMPPKSTYFYPKLLTGIVMNSFSVNDGHGK